MLLLTAKTPLDPANRKSLSNSRWESKLVNGIRSITENVEDERRDTSYHRDKEGYTTNHPNAVKHYPNDLGS